MPPRGSPDPGGCRHRCHPLDTSGIGDPPGAENRLRCQLSKPLAQAEKTWLQRTVGAVFIASERSAQWARLGPQFCGRGSMPIETTEQNQQLQSVSKGKYLEPDVGSNVKVYRNRLN